MKSLFLFVFCLTLLVACNPSPDSYSIQETLLPIAAPMKFTSTANFMATSTHTSTIVPSPLSRPTNTPHPSPRITLTLVPEEDDISPLGPSGMIFIQTGEFQMGCDGENNIDFPCSQDAQPLHKVYLDDYYIDTYETTNGMYAKCVSEKVCSPPSNYSSLTRPSYYGNSKYDNYPVVYVDWYQAHEYCTWAGKRLPTEAEWEKAARGEEDTRPYPWGDFSPGCDIANFMDVGLESCVGDTTEVGSYPLGASLYGVMDMAGNVYEWVNDWYQSNYYSTTPYNNPQGPISGFYKPQKGGAFSYAMEDLIISRRINPYAYEPNEPNRSSFLVGFRCVASP